MLKTKLLANTTRVRGLVDRARKRVHRRSYWDELTKTYPINGLSREGVQRELAKTMAATWQSEDGKPLPGMTMRAGQAYYHHHALGTLDEDLLFNTREPSQAERIALVLSPHQDDAALSIGGLMACRADLEQHLVLNVFTVSAWLGQDFHTAPLAQVTALRAREEALCNQVLGSRSLGLGLWEAEVRNYQRRAVDNYPVREGFVFASDPDLRTLGEQDTVRNSILQAVRLVTPSRIYVPLGLGSHVDHVFMRDTGLAMANALAASGCDVFFYEDQPYATYDHVDAALEVELLQTKQRRLDPHYVDISEHFEQKMQAIAAHRSQFRRSENDERLRHYAQMLSTASGAPQGLSERIWRYRTIA